MAAPIVGITPIFAIYFLGFDWGKNIARKYEGKGPDEQPSTAGIMFAGGFSAIPGTVVMVPGDRIKVILQTQGQSSGPPKYNGPVDCFKKVIAEEGAAGLYRGTALTFARDCPGSVAYYGGYEIIKGAMTTPGTDASVATVLFAGGMGGILNWLVAVPPDTLKSRFQTAAPGTYAEGWEGIRQCTKDVLAEGGVRSLYRGLAPALARAFPANAACFLGMETSRKYLNMFF